MNTLSKKSNASIPKSKSKDKTKDKKAKESKEFSRTTIKNWAGDTTCMPNDKIRDHELSLSHHHSSNHLSLAHHQSSNKINEYDNNEEDNNKSKPNMDYKKYNNFQHVENVNEIMDRIKELCHFNVTNQSHTQIIQGKQTLSSFLNYYHSL